MMNQFVAFKFNGRLALFVIDKEKYNYYLGFHQFLKYLI